MARLLDLAYLLAALAALPWFAWRVVSRGEGRGFLSRFGVGAGEGPSASIWLHGASAGEVSLLQPLVRRLERDLPEVPIVVSSFSASGLAVARKVFPRHRVLLFPFDLSPVVERLLRRFDPRLIVVAESDLWPNFLLAAHRRGIPVAVVNGRISTSSCRWYARTRLGKAIHGKVRLFAAQSEGHAERLRRLGARPGRVHVTGNMKYDLAVPAADPAAAEALRGQLGYGAGRVVVIGGSLHEGEDEALLAAWRQAAGGSAASSALIIVPRYPAEAGRVARKAREQGCRPVLKTALAGGARPPGGEGVLIVDTLGELAALYAAADVAFVGGSLFPRGRDKGGHNLMEPAIQGLPVLFGPCNASFAETARALRQAGAGAMVRDAGELARALLPLLDDGAARREMGARAREVVLSRQGATKRNYALIRALVASGPESLPPRNGGGGPRHTGSPCAGRLSFPSRRRSAARVRGGGAGLRGAGPHHAPR